MCVSAIATLSVSHTQAVATQVLSPERKGKARGKDRQTLEQTGSGEVTAPCHEIGKRERRKAGRKEEREGNMRETDPMGVERDSQMGERWRGRPREGAK